MCWYRLSCKLQRYFSMLCVNIDIVPLFWNLVNIVLLTRVHAYWNNQIVILLVLVLCSIVSLDTFKGWIGTPYFLYKLVSACSFLYIKDFDPLRIFKHHNNYVRIANNRVKLWNNDKDMRLIMGRRSAWMRFLQSKET